jgi:hypothetical protein
MRASSRLALGGAETGVFGIEIGGDFHPNHHARIVKYTDTYTAATNITKSTRQHRHGFI